MMIIVHITVGKMFKQKHLISNNIIFVINEVFYINPRLRIPAPFVVTRLPKGWGLGDNQPLPRFSL